MKKSILLLSIVITSAVSNLKAQGIYSDANFLKATNHLFSSCFTLDDLVKVKQQSEDKNRFLIVLKMNLRVSKKCYETIKTKYSTDQQLIQLKKWNDDLQTVVDRLSKENWETDPQWPLMYSLIRTQLQVMVFLKLN